MFCVFLSHLLTFHEIGNCFLMNYEILLEFVIYEYFEQPLIFLELLEE